MLEERYTMQSIHSNQDDKFVMNFGTFDTESLFNPQMGPMNMGGIKRSAHEAGLDRDSLGISSDEDSNDIIKKDVKQHASSCPRDPLPHHHHNHQHHSQQQQHTSLEHHQSLSHGQHDSKQGALLPNGKKTKGRVKIKMEFIDNKLRRYTTFSKRKTGIMKKAYELSTLTGTQVMLLVASETGHVYTFATRKLQPMITSEAGKGLIQTCLNSPDQPVPINHQHEQRMSATGYEETELTYAVTEEEQKVRQMMYSNPMSSMHQPGQMATPSQHSSLGLQSHHHPSHYPPQPPPTPHLTPTSTNHPLTHTMSSHSEHLNAVNHHSPHLTPNTPLPAQSPLPPPPSPICTSSPSSPYPLLHHHPHHPIPSHNR